MNPGFIIFWPQCLQANSDNLKNFQATLHSPFTNSQFAYLAAYRRARELVSFGYRFPAYLALRRLGFLREYSKDSVPQTSNPVCTHYRMSAQLRSSYRVPVSSWKLRIAFANCSQIGRANEGRPPYLIDLRDPQDYARVTTSSRSHSPSPKDGPCASL